MHSANWCRQGCLLLCKNLDTLFRFRNGRMSFLYICLKVVHLPDGYFLFKLRGDNSFLLAKFIKSGFGFVR